MSDFEGFDYPEQNWFRMPRSWPSITVHMSSLAELKVIEYVLCHTWGFGEYGGTKRITIDEFMRGRRRSDGSRLDEGTGLSERGVQEGLKKAVIDGYLLEEIDDSDKGRIKRYFSLRMKVDGGGQSLPLSPQSLPLKGAQSKDRTEKDPSERIHSKGRKKEDDPAKYFDDPKFGHLVKR